MLVELKTEGGEIESYNAGMIFKVVPLTDGKTAGSACEIHFCFAYEQEYRGVSPHYERIDEPYQTVLRKIGKALKSPKT